MMTNDDVIRWNLSHFFFFFLQSTLLEQLYWITSSHKEAELLNYYFSIMMPLMSTCQLILFPLSHPIIFPLSHLILFSFFVQVLFARFWWHLRWLSKAELLYRVLYPNILRFSHEIWMLLLLKRAETWIYLCSTSLSVLQQAVMLTTCGESNRKVVWEPNREAVGRCGSLFSFCMKKLLSVVSSSDFLMGCFFLDRRRGVYWVLFESLGCNTSPSWSLLVGEYWAESLSTNTSQVKKKMMMMKLLCLLFFFFSQSIFHEHNFRP